MVGKFVLKPSGDQLMFNLLAGNSEVILMSERYTRKESALEGIAAVRLNAGVDARYVRRASSAGEPYFVLKASNNEVLGTSEMYASARGREYPFDESVLPRQRSACDLCALDRRARWKEAERFGRRGFDGCVRAT